MKPNIKFTNLPPSFWSSVRTLSQHIGYTKRGQKQIKVPTLAEMIEAFNDLNLNAEHLGKENEASAFGANLIEYFSYRAHVLNTFVEPRLMDANRAKNEFEKLKAALCPNCIIPMNKQKGEKKAPAYLTGIINMLIEANAKGIECDFDPRELTSFTVNGVPLRTLARRVDGAFPQPINPIAVWEIKEYYYTTTFGSRVADGVYETLLDGMELKELRDNEKVTIKHYLMIDAYYTWWDCGRSYLCRIIDMLHMGYVDEVLFGYEVIEEMPRIVEEWVSQYNAITT